jgi:dihydrodipicolinate reductase
VQATRVVVLGATGNFGARICRALASAPNVRIVAAFGALLAILYLMIAKPLAVASV